MKKITTFACGALLLCSGIMFVGCKEDLKVFDANQVSVGATSVVYNGKDQAFSVSYPNVETQVKYSLDNKSFVSVDELDLEDVCEHDVYYKLSAQGYEDLVGGPINFRITPRDISVKIKTITDYVENRRSESQVINSIELEYVNPADLVSGDELDIDFDIRSYNKELATTTSNYLIVGTDADENYNITIQNGIYRLGDKVSVETSTGGILYYKTIEDAVKAVSQNSIIKLNTNFEEEVVISATTKNLQFKLDLNGYSLKGGLKIQNHDGNEENTSKYTISAGIYNSSSKESYIGSNSNDVGLIVDAGEGTRIGFKNINFLGKRNAFKTSEKFSEASISATECKFGNEFTKGFGVNLCADYSYYFENCFFTGLTGYYTQIGTHKLNKCELWGTRDTHTLLNEDGLSGTGSALIANSVSGYPYTGTRSYSVTIENCVLHTVAGYAIEELVEDGAEDYLRMNLEGANTYDVPTTLPQGPILIVNG